MNTNWLETVEYWDGKRWQSLAEANARAAHRHTVWCVVLSLAAGLVAGWPLVWACARMIEWAAR